MQSLLHEALESEAAGLEEERGAEAVTVTSLNDPHAQDSPHGLYKGRPRE